MRRNFDLSTALVAIGAIAVLVSLFLEWYSPGLKAWDVFEIVDWALLALAVAALVVAGAEASSASAPTARLGWICGIVALIVIAQVLDPPPAARDASREIGAWVALAGSAVMVIGAVLALAQISVTIDVSERERRRRTAAVDARSGDESPGTRPAAAGTEGGDRGGRPAADAEAGGRAAGAETDAGGRSGLWGKGGRRPASADESPRREPIITPPPAPDEDPDRTQPLSPADKPREG